MPLCSISPLESFAWRSARSSEFSFHPAISTSVSSVAADPSGSRRGMDFRDGSSIGRVQNSTARLKKLVSLPSSDPKKRGRLTRGSSGCVVRPDEPLELTGHSEPTFGRVALAKSRAATAGRSGGPLSWVEQSNAARRNRSSCSRRTHLRSTRRSLRFFCGKVRARCESPGAKRHVRCATRAGAITGTPRKKHS